MFSFLLALLAVFAIVVLLIKLAVVLISWIPLIAAAAIVLWFAVKAMEDIWNSSDR